jgi:hypothetical protein
VCAETTNGLVFIETRANGTRPGIDKDAYTVCREGLIEARIRVLVALLERTPGVVAAYPFPKGYFAQAVKAPGSQALAGETTYQTSFFVSVVFPPRQGRQGGRMSCPSPGCKPCVRIFCV